MRAEKWLYTIPLRLRSLLRREQVDLELDDELRYHIECKAEEEVARGMSPDAARRAALVELRGLERAKEECRDVRRVSWLQDLARDLRYGLRMLRKSPAFSTVAVLTLALGIGANASIFAVVNTVLLESLPVRAANRIVVIWVTNHKSGWARIGPTGQDYLDWKEESKSFEDLFLFEHGTGTVTGSGEPQQVAGLRVTTNFGDFFGIKPVLGRTFRVGEGESRHNFAVLAYRYWQLKFGADPGVVGRSMTLNGEEYTIIGVLPARLDVLFPVDVVVPFDREWLKRAESDLGVFGRLRRGTTLGQASSEMNVIMERMAERRPQRKDYGALLVPLEAARTEYLRPALLVVFCAVVLVLLIACVNVANLTLARAVGRHREVAVRMALGAGRARLIRQFLAESTLLALLGCVAGSILGVWSTLLLTRYMPSRIPVPNAADAVLLPRIHLSATVFLFTFLVSLLTGVVFGLVPVFHSFRSDVNETLKEGGRGFLESPRGERTRAILVIVESALAVALVFGAGLMIKSFSHLLAANPGFHPDHLLTVRIKLPNDRPDSRYREPKEQMAEFQRFLGRVETAPGIQAAALAEIVPLSQDDMDMGFFVVKEQPPLPPGQHLAADYRDVSPSFFATMGIRLIKGRVFTDQDDLDHPRVVIIDETLARRFFRGQNPIGLHLEIPDAGQKPREVVGTVGGVRDTGFAAEPRPTIYFPSHQTSDQTMSLVVRTALPVGVALPEIKRAIWSVDKDQPVFNVRTMDEIVSGVLSAERLASLMLGAFAFLALTLAAVGIYGVTSYTVRQRSHEIGLRMALGAQQRDVMGLVVKRGVELVVVGIAIGGIASAGLTRLMSSLLFGVAATDPLTFLGVAILLTLVACGACYLPARRASRVDPMITLRQE
ncbi:MAG TPA: ABC transporter permease [Candidatus Cybelea sp.]|nr:ABC transporter permease [Candidatus Cybelea sp.]